MDEAFAIPNAEGEKVLFLFEEEDDAIRYGMMVDDKDIYEEKMEVIEIDDELAISACIASDYKYTIVTPYDIVIPMIE